MVLVCAGLWAHTLTVYDYQGASPSNFPSQCDEFMLLSYTWVTSYHLIGGTRGNKGSYKNRRNMAGKYAQVHFQEVFLATENWSLK